MTMVYLFFTIQFAGRIDSREQAIRFTGCGTLCRYSAHCKTDAAGFGFRRGSFVLGVTIGITHNQPSCWKLQHAPV